MTAYVFPSLASAAACAAIVDPAIGCPIAGVNVGGGIHAPASQSATTTYAQPSSGSGTQAGSWLYPADATTTPILTAAPSTAALSSQGIVLPAPSAVASVALAL